MKIKVFPRPKRSGSLNGVLGLFASTTKNSFCLNCLSETPELLANKEKSQHLLLSSPAMLNICGLDRLASSLAKEKTSLKIHAPKLFSGWLHALIMETDYKSQSLKKLDFECFDAFSTSKILDDGDFFIEYLKPSDFASYAFRLSFSTGNNPAIFFCELSNPESPLPEEFRGAANMIINLAAHQTHETPDLHKRLISKLHDAGIGTAILPHPEGIMLTLPETDPEFLEMKKDCVELSIKKDCVVKILHEQEFKTYRDAIFPVLLEDEKGGGGVILGLGKGTVLQHDRKAVPSSVIITSSSYSKIFCCADLIARPASNAFEVICGKTMANALKYFGKSCPVKTREALISESDEKKTTKHSLLSSLEVLMIPYPGNPDAFLARIKDTVSGEYLIYTENPDDLKFLAPNLTGIYTLVAAFESCRGIEKEMHTAKLKELQTRHAVERLVILFPGETLMFNYEPEN